MERIFGRLRRLLRARRGVTALEFALVMPVLLTLMLMVMEGGILLFGQAALDAATSSAARLIRTGQVQQAASGQTLFTTSLCNGLSGVVGCSSLWINVQSGTSFATLTSNVSATGSPGVVSFSPGGPGSDVLVQVGYTPDSSIPLVGALLARVFSPLMVSTQVFQNEAY
jgi:Flp pilus assembly protein TadG